MAPYQYEPLKPDLHEIRLLHLHAGQYDDNLCGELVVCSLPPRQRPANPHSDFDWDVVKRVTPDGWRPMETLGRRILIKRFEPEYTTAWLDPELEAQARVALPQSAGSASEKPDFEALSYVWGPEEDQPADVIQLIDASSTTPSGGLPIRTNLSIALRHLRYQNRPRVMWIDAVCIHQDNEEEKNHQVAGMAKIYEMADTVVAWLGPADVQNTSRGAMEAIDYIGRQVVLGRDDTRAPAPGCEEKNWYRTGCPIPYDEYQWSSIVSLLSRPWFKRLWVWQEIQLSSAKSMVKCGQDDIPWTAFRQAIICLGLKTSIPSSTQGVIEQKIRMTLDSRAVTLGYILEAVKDSACENPQDKVYGILGLITDSLPADWQPSYQLPVVDAFKDVLLASASHTKSLNLLRFCDNSEAKPSWVPNWYDRGTAKRKPLLPSCDSEMHNASAGVEASFEDLGGGILEVESVSHYAVAAINESTVPFQADGSYLLEDLARTVQSWEPDGLVSRSYCAGGSLHDAFVVTLCGNMTTDAYPNTALPLLSEYRSVVKKLLGSSLMGSAESESLAWMQGDPSVGFIAANLAGRRFITSEQGHIGRSPSATLPGDEVHILLGCNAPLILRPTAGRYKVVGQAYVHGLMQGEAILGPLPDDTIVQYRLLPSKAYEKTYKVVRGDSIGTISRSDPRLLHLQGVENPSTADVLALRGIKTQKIRLI